MKVRLNELQLEYQAKVNRANEIRVPYAGKSDSMNQEEIQEFDGLMADADRLMESIEQEVKAAVHDKFMDTPAGKVIHPGGGDGDGDSGGDGPDGKAKGNKAFAAWLKYGDQALTNESIPGMKAFKALQVDVDTLGGYLVAPQEFVAELIQVVDDLVFIRGLATVKTLTLGVSLGAPSLDTDLSDASWTSELLDGGQDDTLRFGKRELFPHPLAKRVLISNKMLNAPGLNAEAIVSERMAYRFGVAQENAFLTGSGSGQPLGVFTASADGISTGRDVSTGNTTSEIGADGLIEAKFALKAAYWARATWIFHRDALKQIRLLKDGNGQYMWSPGLAGGIAPAILDMPFLISEFAPNTFTTGLYVGILGDFSRYWIADSLTMQVQRLIELYAATNQTGFIGRLETDGMPVLEEAFVRVILA